MDAKTLFDDRLPKIISEDPQKAKEVNAIYVFNVTGDGGGTWTIDLKSDAPGVSQGDTGSADCTIELSNEDLGKIIEDPGAGMQLFFEGKLKVDGDPMLATKMQEVLKLGN
ncbi:MAG: SCP2 sterol-binding domain-containing protein [Deltaproteobacteria bacterium]|nr:SCP2 sterol-binding domain-containing protein [Deltaproteobacteria bacterium]